jgi:hypothetical protein
MFTILNDFVLIISLILFIIFFLNANDTKGDSLMLFHCKKETAQIPPLSLHSFKGIFSTMVLNNTIVVIAENLDFNDVLELF